MNDTGASKRPYTLRLIAGTANILIFEEKSTPPDIERCYLLSSSYGDVGRICLYAEYSPSVAVHLPWVFVWGGVRLFFFDLDTLQLRHREFDDELRAVYQLGDGWCIVGETTVAAVGDLAGPVTKMYNHTEIIMKHRWNGTTLWLEDWNRVRFSLDLTAPTLVAVEDPADTV